LFARHSAKYSNRPGLDARLILHGCSGRSVAKVPAVGENKFIDRCGTEHVRVIQSVETLVVGQILLNQIGAAAKALPIKRCGVIVSGNIDQAERQLSLALVHSRHARPLSFDSAAMPWR